MQLNKHRYTGEGRWSTVDYCSTVFTDGTQENLWKHIAICVLGKYDATVVADCRVYWRWYKVSVKMWSFPIVSKTAVILAYFTVHPVEYRVKIIRRNKVEAEKKKCWMWWESTVYSMSMNIEQRGRWRVRSRGWLLRRPGSDWRRLLALTAWLESPRGHSSSAECVCLKASPVSFPCASFIPDTTVGRKETTAVSWYQRTKSQSMEENSAAWQEKQSLPCSALL